MGVSPHLFNGIFTCGILSNFLTNCVILSYRSTEIKFTSNQHIFETMRFKKSNVKFKMQNKKLFLNLMSLYFQYFQNAIKFNIFSKKDHDYGSSWMSFFSDGTYNRYPKVKIDS